MMAVRPRIAPTTNKTATTNDHALHAATRVAHTHLGEHGMLFFVQQPFVLGRSANLRQMLRMFGFVGLVALASHLSPIDRRTSR
jgi:hypothetical protein